MRTACSIVEEWAMLEFRLITEKENMERMGEMVTTRACDTTLNFLH